MQVKELIFGTYPCYVRTYLEPCDITDVIRKPSWWGPEQSSAVCNLCRYILPVAIMTCLFIYRHHGSWKVDVDPLLYTGLALPIVELRQTVVCEAPQHTFAFEFASAKGDGISAISFPPYCYPGASRFTIWLWLCFVMLYSISV